ncbi:C4-dicarboxylate ABC transporter [Anaerosporomusa subterranea]|uniref:C4-dicarboxylate ABC transporter n=1 Tax=Anaerosporomusa subterranea TaxID=1794912 RepID=A0A154BVR1_ANASB|nr:C4-dicarboxylate transporter DcuC [Anaerosporomusa subterranea]KYZ78031.1 C4-dicarboxylate ABC transporter [Anaerosporomusa subterranea]
MMIVIGGLIVIATIYFLLKRYDSRLVLLVSGVLMAVLAGKPMEAFNAFAKSMTEGSLIQAICSVMGFALVMKVTGCDKHLINFFAKWLTKVRPLLIPGATLATFAINIALPSAAGAAAAVGAIFIPLLMSAGIHPATAAAAVKSGTYGSMLSPGLAHNGVVAKLAQVDVMTVIGVHYLADIASVVIAALGVTAVAVFLKEHKGYELAATNADGTPASGTQVMKTNILYAFVPLIPIVILLLGASGKVPVFKMGVPQAMLIGSIIALVVTRKNPVEVTKSFFDGMGNAYAQIMGIVIAAGVFVSGMNALGLVNAFIAFMLNSTGIVKLAAAFGPFALGIISGSGDAAAFAFNEAVTPHAQKFGLDVISMGSMASLGGALGRTMSPITGATIILAGIAGVNPMEIAKRNTPGMIIAIIVAMFILL